MNTNSQIYIQDLGAYISRSITYITFFISINILTSATAINVQYSIIQ